MIHKEMGTPRLTRALFCFASLFLTKFDANPHFVWTEKKKNGPIIIVSREKTRSLALRATHSFVDDILGALNSSIFPSFFVFFLPSLGLNSLVASSNELSLLFSHRKNKIRRRADDNTFKMCATREFSPKEGRKKTKKEGKIEEFNAPRMSSTKE